jgi:hypothetical protein
MARKYQMRTWKQGVIGKLQLQKETCVFTKCLKYPLMKIYRNYYYENRILENEIYTIFVALDVLKAIEKVDYIKLTNDEKQFGLLFNPQYTDGSSKITEIDNSKSESINNISNRGIVNLDELTKLLHNM